MKPSAESTAKVVFFDGVCGFCNQSVDVLLRADKGDVLKFAPLQGEYAKGVLSNECIVNIDTIIYQDGMNMYHRSEAVLRILCEVGGLWKIFYPLIVIPGSWRDWAYCAFARNRYKWFGKKDACRIPTPEERSRFLD